MLTEPRYQYFNIPPHWPRYFSISHEIKTLTETLQSVCLSVSHGTGLIEGRLTLTGELSVALAVTQLKKAFVFTFDKNLVRNKRKGAWRPALNWTFLIFVANVIKHTSEVLQLKANRKCFGVRGI